MDSSSRNSRRSLPALAVAIAGALLLGSAARADDQRPSFVLTAYSNGTGGHALVSGDYQAAVRQLQEHSYVSAMVPPGTLANNRCVALAMTKQWDAARSACDAAVHDAELARSSLSFYNLWTRESQNDFVAIALSNRAVLHWIQTEPAAAERDLDRAGVLAPKAGYVASNLAALHSKQAAVAQVVGIAQR